jgi:hypothetical protein
MVGLKEETIGYAEAAAVHDNADLPAGSAIGQRIRRQGLARSRSPLGLFLLDDESLVKQAWSIDGHPFLDEDGSLWLFYKTRTKATSFEGRPGSGTVVDRLLSPDRLARGPVWHGACLL